MERPVRLLSFHRPAVLALALVGMLAGARGFAAPPASVAPTTRPAVTAAASDEVRQYTAWVNELAGEAMAGRGNGQPGLDKARDLLVEHFRRVGLNGAFGGQHCQPFQAVVGRQAVASLAVLDDLGRVLKHARPARDCAALELSAHRQAKGPMVFVGYGLREPEHSYDSYAACQDQSLAGRVAVILRYEPLDEQGVSLWSKRAGQWCDSARIASKVTWAARFGAQAVVLLDPTDRGGDLPTELSSDVTFRAGVPVLRVSRAWMHEMLATGGCVDPARRLGDLIRRSNQGPVLENLDAPALKLEVADTPIQAMLENVAAVLPGAGELAHEVVVVGAHYDHLGRRGAVVYPGADDNASGTAAMMLLAQRLARRQAQGRQADGAPLPPNRRTIVFVAFAGEEIGLLGSRHMAKHVEALGLRDARIVAMLNLDMVGRLRRNSLDVLGSASGDAWRSVVSDSAVGTGLNVIFSDIPLAASDHLSFIGQGIPALMFCTGIHTDMHRESDRAEAVNVAGAVEVVGLVDRVLEGLWTGRHTVRPPAQAIRVSASARPYAGLAVERRAVSGGLKVLDAYGPARQADIRPGDIIQRIDGQAVGSFDDLQKLMAAHRPGDVLTVRLIREGQVVETQLTLAGKTTSRPQDKKN